VTAEEVESFRRQGYLLVPQLLSRDQVAGFAAAVDVACAGNTRARHDSTRVEMEPEQPPDGTRVRRLYEPCTHYPEFRALSESPALLDRVSALIGPDLLFHYSKLNMKPPSVGSVVEWHQDLAYYPLSNDDSLAVLLYLDDADAGNGCLRVIPGGTGRPLLDHTRDGYFQGRITEAVDEAEAVALEGKAGAAIFLHGLTPHASVANTSGRPRRTLILSYRAADAFPLHVTGITEEAERHVRRVRGERLQVARFTRSSIPVPRYRRRVASLYELQESARCPERT
jgi:phytanoyl-CoA hydroxylase